MHNFNDDTLLYDDRLRWGSGDTNEVDDGWADDGDAYTLEDLLRLVQESDHLKHKHQTPDEELSSVGFDSDEDALLWGLSVLCQSPLGRSMAFDARFDDWALEVDDIEDGHPIVDAQLRIIIIPRGTPSALSLSRAPQERLNFLVNLARGLRMMWHAMHDVLPRPDITIDDQILFERLRHADRDIITLRIFWDLRTVGYNALWRAMIAGALGDVAMAATHYWDDHDTSNGLAQAFLIWMGSDTLVAACDNHTLDMIDDMQQRNGTEVWGPHTLSAYDILNISRLSDDISYLAPIARTLCYSPEFRVITDPVNEAHVRQILEESNSFLPPSLTFRDSTLARKIFPDMIVDTLA